MELDPVVVKMNVPDAPEPVKKIPKLPHFTEKSTKILTIIAAVVICLTMMAFVIFVILANNSTFKEKQGLDLGPKKLPAQSTSTSLSKNALPGGGIATGSGGSSGTNAPEITLTADPSSTTVGNSVTLTWKVTKNPVSCVASDDWAAGNKESSGSEKTQTLTKVQTYIFTLTCKTATGTSFSSVKVGAVGVVSTGSAETRPHVTFAATPAGIYTGQLATLSWNATNNPASCVASGDWSGNKATTGSQSTGVLSTARTYTYKLMCSNSGGSETVTATVSVTDAPPGVPVILIYGQPVSPVTKGTDVTITWSVTNNPKSCTASGAWSGAKPSSGTFQTGPLNTLGDFTYTITCTDSSGSNPLNASADVSVVPPPPVISLTASPSTIFVGQSSTLTWSATNSPTSCTASGSWSGTKAASGTQSTGTLNTIKSYGYNLTCVNAGGSQTVSNVPVNVVAPPAPVVSLSANPISVTTGGSSTLTWSSTNNPSSCSASGDWTGTKTSSGTIGTGTLTTAKTYTYTLTCSNAGGSDSATTTVTASSGVTASPPAVTISVTNPIGTGSAGTISWSATNTPTSCTASGNWSGAKSASGSQSTGTMTTAGNYTYSLSCTNSAGTGSKSATTTVIAVPTVGVTLDAASITAGGSTTIRWTVGNSATSCTAGGSWSGSKAVGGGNQSTGAMPTAGSYTYSLSCTNTGGTGTGSATLTVSPPVVTYCSGNTPCYGPADLLLHNVNTTTTHCWGYNVNRVVDITSLNNGYHKNSPGDLFRGGTGICGNINLAPYLSGSSSISGLGSHGHKGSTIGNTGTIAGYLVGYYDASKP